MIQRGFADLFLWQRIAVIEATEVTEVIDMIDMEEVPLQPLQDLKARLISFYNSHSEIIIFC
jgi:hypothetical protein